MFDRKMYKKFTDIHYILPDQIYVPCCIYVFISFIFFIE